MQKTIIIGLDGVPFGLLKDFADSGVMPNTASIIANGIFRKMRSSIPEVSSVAWSSMITGKNPGEHGIFGFTDLYPNSYRLVFPNFSNLKVPPFWDNGKFKSVIINVPSTYPVVEMNGVHISGFVSLDLERSVYPKTLVPKLQEFDYRLDVESHKGQQSLEWFLKDLNKTLEARINAYRYLWDSQEWDVFMLVFTGTDRLMHFLWDAYEDEGHKYHEAFLEHFRKVDEAIGEIKAKLCSQDRLVMLGDHGFEKLEKDVYISCPLKEQGLLSFQDGGNCTLGNIDFSSKAFALDPARIYVNKEGKYPQGSVSGKDMEKILNDLESLFGELEINGKKAIKSIYRKEEIFSGPYLERAPDMVLIGAEGFNLNANPKADKLFDKGIFTGKHTLENTFLLVNESCERDVIPEDPKISDVAEIIKIEVG